jgi:hypothetical protein
VSDTTVRPARGHVDASNRRRESAARCGFARRARRDDDARATHRASRRASFPVHRAARTLDSAQTRRNLRKITLPTRACAPCENDSPIGVDALRAARSASHREVENRVASARCDASCDARASRFDVRATAIKKSHLILNFANRRDDHTRFR